MKRVWVDFNAVADERVVAQPRGTVITGQPVTAFDGEGLACNGTIETIYPNKVTVALDLGTLRDEEPMTVEQIRRFETDDE